jgi:hypothetical protein
MTRILLVAFVVSLSAAANGQTPARAAVQGQLGGDWVIGSDARLEGRVLHIRDFTITLDGRELRADEASVNLDTKQLELRGNVILTLPNGVGGFYKIDPR